MQSNINKHRNKQHMTQTVQGDLFHIVSCNLKREKIPQVQPNPKLIIMVQRVKINLDASGAESASNG